MVTAGTLSSYARLHPESPSYTIIPESLDVHASLNHVTLLSTGGQCDNRQNPISDIKWTKVLCIFLRLSRSDI